MIFGHESFQVNIQHRRQSLRSTQLMSSCCIEDTPHVRAPSSILRQAVPYLSVPNSHCFSKPVPIVKYFATTAQTPSSSFNSLRQLQLTFPHDTIACASSNSWKYRKSSSSDICFVSALIFFAVFGILILPSSPVSSSSLNRSL